MTVTTRPPAGVPRYDADLFTDEARPPVPAPAGVARRRAGRLARLEGGAVLMALVERVDTIALDGPPVRKRNNLIRSFRSLPVTVAPTGPG